MPVQTVRTRSQTVQGMVTKVDLAGGLFTPVPGKGQRPAYTFGHPNATTRPVMFQCPVSAIPEELWDLLALWWNCRKMRALPCSGGYLDQPLIVRRAFPVFESEMTLIEHGRSVDGPQQAAALAVGAVVKMMGGGRRGARK